MKKYFAHTCIQPVSKLKNFQMLQVLSKKKSAH